MSKYKNAILMTIASVLSYFMTMFVIFGNPILSWDIPGRAYIVSILAIGASYGISYSFLKLVKVENPSKKAIISALIGFFSFWASCVALIIALYPALSNM